MTAAICASVVSNRFTVFTLMHAMTIGSGVFELDARPIGPLHHQADILD
jgi:hypothetical protein